MAATVEGTQGHASLVTDVLQKTGRLEKENYQACIRKMLKKADEVKAEVLQSIYKEYTHTEFLDFSSSTVELNWKVNHLLSEIESLSTKIQGNVQCQLDAVASEFTDLTKQLQDTDVIVQELSKLYKIHEAFELFPMEMKNREYYKAAQLVELVKKHLDQLPKFGQQGKIFVALRDEWRRQKSQLIHKLETLWVNSLTWTTATTASLDSRDGHLKTKLALSEGGSSMETNLQAMQVLGILDKRLKACGKKVVQFLLRPLIIFPSLKPQIDVGAEGVSISLLKDATKTKAVDPGKLYPKLLDVLSELRKHFCGEPLPDDKTSISDSGGAGNIFSQLGKQIWPSLSEDLIRECLAKCIPTTSSQLEKYQGLINATKSFENSVLSLGLMSKENMTLTLYVCDVSVHFGNKKCQDLLATARDLMKDDVHTPIEVDLYTDRAQLGNLEDLSNETSAKAKAPKEPPSKQDAAKTLSQFTFHFPSCKISENTKKLVDLVYDTLTEATQSIPQTATQLFYTVRNMFQLFCHVVPTYHKESLDKLPQLAALHHNNCMYIAHHLLTLGHQFRPNLPDPLNQSAATFIDLVPTIRQLGENCLVEQLRKQRSRLCEIVKGIGGFADAHEDVKRENMERAVKQILHQLIHLGKVWQGILPKNIYRQALGALLDSVLQATAGEVFQLEDISADEAHQLHSLLTVLLERSPEMFREDEPTEASKELCAVVPHWNRFEELIGILEASLQDIVDRWTDGKGPLAHEFTAPEIRGLIRALFQNTDRRAAVLVRIKPVSS